MNALELLGRLGEVEQADPAVLDAALERFAEAAGGGARQVAPAPAAGRGHRRIEVAAGRTGRLLRAGAVLAAAGALTAAATFAMRTGPDGHRAGHRGAVSRPAGPLRRANGAGSGAAPAGGAATIAASLAAFRASSGDILRVTKTMRGDFGTEGKTVIWVSPAAAAPGARVRVRIQSYTLDGARLTDQVIAYTSARPAATGASCTTIFRRPRIESPGPSGLRGTATVVYYPGRDWGSGPVSVRAATLPSSAGLRACLTAGRWKKTGRAAIGRTRVIELANTLVSSGYERLWVSAATLLPVRLVSGGPGTDTFTFDFRFLPPTGPDLALLTAPSIPAGFRKSGL